MEAFHINNNSDLPALFGAIKKASNTIGMKLVKQTQLITAVSELCTNVFKYAGTGIVTVAAVSTGAMKRITVVVSDQGPGIADIETAMQRGYSSGNTLGIGLPGAKTLCDEFRIKSHLGEGTTITIVKWV